MLNLSELEKMIKFAKLEEIRNDIVKFAEYVMRDENGNKWKVPDFHKELYQLLLETVQYVFQLKKAYKGRQIDSSKRRNVIILAPREHGKTSLITCFLLYILGKYPTLRIKYVSSSDAHSRMVLGLIKRNIEMNNELHEVFPNLVPDPKGRWSATDIDILKGEDDAELGIKDPSLSALGVTSSATGGRADIIVFDDMIGSRSAVMEPGRMEAIKQIFWQDWMNIGRYCNIVIGTPWTENDIHADLCRHPQWIVWKKPAIVDGKPLWPERWPMEELLRKKEESLSAFSLMYMLEGVKKEETWWTPEIIERCKNPSIKLGEVPKPLKYKVLGVDPAAGTKSTSSFSCLTAVGVDEEGIRYILDIKRGKYSSRELAEHVIRLHQIWNFNTIVVENNALQQYVIDLIDLIAKSKEISVRLPLKGLFTGSQKWNPELGLPKLVAAMETGRYVIPFAGNHSDPIHVCPVCYLIKEMLDYPNSETTDMIMSLWLAEATIEDRKIIGDLHTVVEANFIRHGW